jgi:hypothetical protein
VLTNEDGAVEVMALLEEETKALALVLGDKTHVDAGEQVRLAGNWRARGSQGYLEGSGVSSCH